MPRDKALRRIGITRINSGARLQAHDVVAAEEPLEIRIRGRAIAVVMRTPGQDRELVAGFLATEGILRHRDQVLDLVYCRSDTHVPEENVLDVILAPGVVLDLDRLTRHLFTSSSCGLCSKATIEAVRAGFPPLRRRLMPSIDVVAALPAKARAAQAAFAASGGLHASALFTAEGELLVLREDVGRHNALDKVVGHAFFEDRLPLADQVLLVSGRVSFEIMQKALGAGIPCVAAISAPTSAAIEFAQASGQTLIGFLRGEDTSASTRMNVYAGAVL